MFKLAQKEDKTKIESFCSQFPLGVKINCQMNGYGFEKDFLKLWISENETEVLSVLCVFDGSATLCAKKEADFEEIKVLLNMSGTASLCCEKSIFDLLGLEAKAEKRFFEFFGEAEVFEEVQSEGDTKQVYKLICVSIPDSFEDSHEAYLHFLSDFTFRERRSLARLKTISDGEKVLSCAMTAAESEDSALISGVACDKTQRGKGIGKKTVLTLAGELKKENKKVYVIALNDSAGAFYEKIGFKQIETVCFWER